MERELNRAEVIKAIMDLDFRTPLSTVLAVVNNDEYDPENFSEELESSHPEWSWAKEGWNGPQHWQDSDWEGREVIEPEDHKQWRLNHNKQFEKTKMIVAVTPKRVSEGLYKIAEEYAKKIAESFGRYKVYEIYLSPPGFR